MDWWEKYIGKPWEGVPNPPYSYTCGELVRAIHKELWNIDIVPIPVDDASDLRATVEAMNPEYYGFVKLQEHEEPMDGDVAFMARNAFMDHCGIVVQTADGMKILHCANPDGTILNSVTELEEQQCYTKIEFYRHPGINAYLEEHGICRK